jgi:guanine deaminase
MCLGAISRARLRRIYFAATREDAAAAGFSDAEIYRDLALPPDRRAIPGQLLLPEEGLQPFRSWAASTTKTLY